MVIQKYMGTKANSWHEFGNSVVNENSGVAFVKDGVIHFYVKNQYDCLLC